MSRSLAYALLSLIVFVARGSSELNRIKRDTKSGVHWGYEKDDGPPKWAQLNIPDNKCGDDDDQSPVDIDKDDVDANDILDEIEFDNYDSPLTDASIENNGHTVVVTPGENDPILTITEGGLDDTYKFIGLHFHWGSDSKKGSEHTIDGKAYPLEMHLVHMNTNYKTPAEAQKKKDGLAVLAVLFKLTHDDNDDLKPIIDKLDDVEAEGKKADLDDFKVEDLLPDDLMPYYRYDGSLTTPPCSEAVKWTIFEEFAEISEEQLKKFRGLKENDAGEDAESLADNFRPIQSLGGRVIQLATGSATNIPASATMTVVLAALTTAFILLRRV